jgi:hypothetical protein
MPVVLGDNSISVGGKIIETTKSTGLYDNLLVEPTVNVGGPLIPNIMNNDYKCIAFPNNGNNQTSYTVNFPESKTCDILVLAGGGGGGNSMAGGGGAGGMVIATDISLSGTYTINVGKGGSNGVAAEDGLSDGYNSEIFSGTDYNTSVNKIRAYGGGGGGHEFDDPRDNGNNGGNGGGGHTLVSIGGTTLSFGGSVTPAIKSGIFSSGISYGNAGGTGSKQADANNEGAGGGGGCGVGQVGGTGLYRASADTTVSLGGKGGNGLYIGNIFGDNFGVNGWVGGGGGGGSYAGGNTLAAFQDNIGGQGGGGEGGRTYNGSAKSAIAGTNGTGGGGGGGPYAGTGAIGGSGIVIIRYPRTKLPFDAQWTYNALNANVYYLGNVGIGVTNPTNALEVIGNTHSTTYSAGKKTFKIEHPLKINKWLYHGCIEGPRFDNIYRGKKLITEGKCEVDIDAECNTTGGMTSGTFSALNTNHQLYLQNNQTYDVVKGVINGSTISIECENTTDDIEVDWLVVGERHDEHVISTPLTDSDGNLICEHNMPGYVSAIDTNIESENTPVTNVDISSENITDVNN